MQDDEQHARQGRAGLARNDLPAGRKLVHSAHNRSIDSSVNSAFAALFLPITSRDGLTMS